MQVKFSNHTKIIKHRICGNEWTTVINFVAHGLCF